MQDKAGREYWGTTYEGRPEKDIFDPHTRTIRHFWKRGLHSYFVRALSNAEPGARSLLEVGCGGSRMLGYFDREFGMEVSGIDYSEPGCRSARAFLRSEQISGTVICADLFHPPESLLNCFDVVVSFGVIEHFTDTAGCIAAVTKLLKPNGLLITSVPNMPGVAGLLQGWLDRDVLNKHVSLSREDLQQAHQAAGLRVLSCEYLLFINLAVANINETPRGTLSHLIKSFALLLLRAVTGCVWAIESAAGPFRPNRFTSPYIFCAAKKTP